MFSHFNSNLVRLKAKKYRGVFEYLHSFNSNLVRLKARRRVAPCARAKKFQFQSGAIESLTQSNDDMLKELVSIPIWCD